MSCQPNPVPVLDFDEISRLVNLGLLDPEPIRATPEQTSRARAQRSQKRTKKQITEKSEQAVQGWFERGLHASLSKNPVEEKVIHRGTPKERTIRVSHDVDYGGSIPLLFNGTVTTWPLKVEVKGITDDKFPLSNLNDKEREFLDRARNNHQVAWVALVWWDDIYHCNECKHEHTEHGPLRCPQCNSRDIRTEYGIQVMHVIPWKDWPGIEASLVAKRADDKRFGGRSIRRKDWHLLKSYAVCKVRGRWTLDDAHWLRPFIPVRPSQLQNPF